ncbi:DUF1850 domain-containing protein [uncultured Desulfobacter sp.]|uniref:DUF1850 domain-containing protein n=1 Tax=uncultured Desulfobacter sp. TaxID=240139 RepID=UPI002AABE69D|nr:DUF1850 domain-containing protein [uncultured Desulfobacter sp.]
MLIGARVWLWGLLAVCFIPVSVLAAGQIVIVSFPKNNMLLKVSLENEMRFSLSFVHSVSKTRVTDLYEIRGNQIVQIREYFSAHGAGLPSSPEEPDGIRWEKQKSQFVLHMERFIPKLVVRTDKNYENRLKIQSRTINLNQWEDQALQLYIE